MAIKMLGLPISRKENLPRAEIKKWEASLEECQKALDDALNEGYEKIDGQRVELDGQTVMIYLMHKKDSQHSPQPTGDLFRLAEDWEAVDMCGAAKVSTLTMSYEQQLALQNLALQVENFLFPGSKINGKE